ncbi:carbohydrate sulfotransferase 9-like [Babylonia areolata]|uniref:carbohydrate sulfotransferase 9-like n=1 Tax=Babylonia areolata TaxID=304850 RepID=UPI003FD33FCC
MRKRRDILSRFCSTEGEGGSAIFRTNSIVFKHRPLLYCPVGKIASTFLTRFFVAAEDTNPVVSPYVISADKALRMRRKRTGNYILFAPLSQMVSAGAKERQFLERLTRVLFVRCPFHRLWSAYVDKLLFPNPHYWKMWGYPAMRELTTPADALRPNRSSAKAGDTSSSSSPECGQSVTFSQFLHFTVNHLHKHDTHVRPVSEECAPCYANYDVIGHVETLTSDTLYLAGLLHLNVTTLRGLRWEEEHAKDAIREGVKQVFDKFAPLISECMGMDVAGRRLWQVLQIRGIISGRIPYPVGFSQGSVTAAAFEDALLKAHSRSAGFAEELEQQRRVAFMSAYQSVSKELKDRMREVYAADFKMFGFEERLEL